MSVILTRIGSYILDGNKNYDDPTRTKHLTEPNLNGIDYEDTLNVLGESD